MFKKIISPLFLGMFLIFTQGHSVAALREVAGNCFSFVRTYPAAVVGASLTLGVKAFIDKKIREEVRLFEERVKIQKKKDTLNPLIEAKIMNMAKQRGIDSLFICYDYHPFMYMNACAFSISSTQGVIVVGRGLGVGKDEDPNRFNLEVEFTIQHELSHIKNNDTKSKKWNFSFALGAVGALMICAPLKWAPVVGFLGALTAWKVVFPIINYHQEFRADREACQTSELAQAGISSFYREDKKNIRSNRIVPDKKFEIKSLLSRIYKWVIAEDLHPSYQARIAALQEYSKQKFGH